MVTCKLCGFHRDDYKQYLAEHTDRICLERRTEIWYELEYSHKGANDWFSSSTHADSITSINTKVAQSRLDRPDFDWRVTRKVITSEVLPL